MRQILVDYARSRGAWKRGGGAVIRSLEESELPVEERAAGIVALDEVLLQLANIDERLSDVVELRFFGGFSVDEIADLQQKSTRTVDRDWRKARAFLYRALSEPE